MLPMCGGIEAKNSWEDGNCYHRRYQVNRGNDIVFLLLTDLLSTICYSSDSGNASEAVDVYVM